MATLGKNIVIYWNDHIIAGTRSNDFETECDTLEVASPEQGEWREYLTARKKWQVTVGYLVPASSDITDMLRVGNTYTLQFVDRTDRTTLLQGTAILKKCKITASIGSIIQGSFQFQGNGALAEP